jgi:hypothetical protein
MFQLPGLASISRLLRGCALLVIIFATIEVTGQQMLRTGANDPQIQFAEDISVALQNGTEPKLIIPDETAQVDMAGSLTTYVLIYDNDGNVMAGNGRVNGGLPTPPKGVFDVARSLGQNRITWQPMPGVRSAIVIKHVPGDHPGFVLVGRSLREVEIRERALLIQTLLGLGASLIVWIGWSILLWRKPKA